MIYIYSITIFDDIFQNLFAVSLCGLYFLDLDLSCLLLALLPESLGMAGRSCHHKQNDHQSYMSEIPHSSKIDHKVSYFIVPIQMNIIPSRISARSRALARRFLSLKMIAPQINDIMTELRLTRDTTEIIESWS